LFAALMTPVWGRLGDRSSRKWMVVRALVGLALAIFLMGLSRTPRQLLLLRALQGLVSGFIPAAIALVSTMAPASELGFALGTFSSSQAASIVVGPLVGGLLADLVGFRNLFFITAGIELLAAATVMLLVREQQVVASPPTGSVLESARHAGRGPVRTALVGLFLTQLSILLVQSFFALFVESLGVAAPRLSSMTGVLFGVTGLATLGAAPPWGRLSDRIGRRRALSFAFAGGALAFLLQSVVHGVRGLFLLRVMQGLFAAGMLPALYATVASYTREEQRAGVVAFGSSATLLGGLLGPLLGGALAAQMGMRAVFVVSTGFCLLNALNARRLPVDGRAAAAKALGAARPVLSPGRCGQRTLRRRPRGGLPGSGGRVRSAGEDAPKHGGAFLQSCGAGGMRRTRCGGFGRGRCSIDLGQRDGPLAEHGHAVVANLHESALDEEALHHISGHGPQLAGPEAGQEAGVPRQDADLAVVRGHDDALRRSSVNLLLRGDDTHLEQTGHSDTLRGFGGGGSAATAVLRP
jgi:MFS family permease